MGYNPLIHGVCWGYNQLTNLLLTSWDIQVCHVAWSFWEGIFWLFCSTSFFLEIHENSVATGSVFRWLYRPFPSCNWDINHPRKPYVHHPSCNWVVNILGASHLLQNTLQRLFPSTFPRKSATVAKKLVYVSLGFVFFCDFLRIATTGFSTYSTTLVLCCPGNQVFFEFRYTSRKPPQNPP